MTVFHCRQKQTDPRPRITRTENFMKFRRVVFWATACKTVRPVLSDRCLSVLSCLSVCGVALVYCGQTVRWIKMSLGTEVGFCPGNNVLDADPVGPRKGALFGLCLL